MVPSVRFLCGSMCVYVWVCLRVCVDNTNTPLIGDNPPLTNLGANLYHGAECSGRVQKLLFQRTNHAFAVPGQGAKGSEARAA